MRYEVYLDNLFLVNFLMNLFCLELTNISLKKCTSRRRVLAGAAFGALLYLFPFLVPGNVFLRVSSAFLVSAAGMLFIVFPIKGIGTAVRVAERLFLCTFLMGGGILFLIRLFPAMRGALTSVLGILGIGALLFMEITYLVEKSGKAGDIYEAVLLGNGRKVGVRALIDTGNSLIEPISGKPVCILEKSVFEKLWSQDAPRGFRAIPYHSVGTRSGILPGYLIPEIHIEVDGILHRCMDVYVGLVNERLAGGGEYSMILNPRVLKEEGYDHKDRVARKASF